MTRAKKMPQKSWRHAARQAAYEYPGLRERLRDLQSMSMTPSLSGMPMGGGEHRSTEDAALRQLPPEDQRRLDAVGQALEISGHLTSGLARVKMIEMVYFRRSHTLEGAALRIPCDVRTVKTWNNDFLLLIWSKMQG